MLLLKNICCFPQASPHLPLSLFPWLFLWAYHSIKWAPKLHLYDWAHPNLASLNVWVFGEAATFRSAIRFVWLFWRLSVDIMNMHEHSWLPCLTFVPCFFFYHAMPYHGAERDQGSTDYGVAHLLLGTICHLGGAPLIRAASKKLFVVPLELLDDHWIMMLIIIFIG